MNLQNILFDAQTERLAALALAAALMSWALVGLVLVAAQRTALVAAPGDRSLHVTPTPVGGGLGLIAATLGFWLVGVWPPSHATALIAVAVAALAVLSFLDDRLSLPALLRFLLQAAVIGWIVWALPPEMRLAPSVPLVAERVLLAVAWLWLVNLTNFMDGIDGLAAIEGITVAIGYLAVRHLSPATSLAATSGVAIVDQPTLLAAVLVAACAGFLAWNWPPARIFMGDVGSIPLGFLFGLLMLDLARRGAWPAALILPLYFLLDATLTLLDRLRRGQRPWRAHRDHAYQRAVLAGLSHARVTLHVAILDIALIALAVTSLVYPLPALAAAAAMTIIVFAWFHARRAPPS